MAVVDRVQERADSVAHELVHKGIDAIALAADVTAEDQVAAMVAGDLPPRAVNPDHAHRLRARWA